MRSIPHYINGAAASAPGELPVFNPATGETTARVPVPSTTVVDEVVASSRAAWQTWRNSTLSQRTNILFTFRQLLVQHTDELAALITSEHGKTIADAKGEIARGLENVEYACGLTEHLKGGFSSQVADGVDVHSFRESLGVVVAVTPFNFPIMVPLWMTANALATGNVVVLKPSERDPSASNFVAELYREAGLPDGVFNVVHGDKVAVDAILDHPDVAGVSFVGSTPIARYVHERATQRGKRVQALGGAKNHAVVMADADLDYAADQLTAAGFGSAGQRCMAISVVVAVGACADPLLERLAERARAVKVGPGLDPTSEMGPVVTAEARERILGYIEQGLRDGAVATVDGREIETGTGGFFIGPTLFDRASTNMSIYTEEIFGPVLTVIRVDSLEEAIELINESSFANGTAIFTSSGQAARRFQREVNVGMIGINVPIPVPMAYYSFGGWKDSLFGDHHIHGAEGIRFYTRAKAVTTRWPADGTGGAGRGLNFPTNS